MNFVMDLDGETCTNCGETLVWWQEDETETTIEVYVECMACGSHCRKEFVSKSDDTSHGALEEIAHNLV